MNRFQAFEGNLVADPELKTFEDGNASVRFRLIDNPSRTDRRTGEVIKETPVAMSCVARDPFARNIAATAKKGQRLLVWGTLKSREYTDKDGNKRTADYLSVEAAGSSLRFSESRPSPAAERQSASAPWPEVAQPGAGAAG
jgi:single-strand DNA-binding protein